MYLAIDFGTCNTKAALVIEDQPILVRDPFQPESSFFPSSVYVEPGGQKLVGHGADAMRDTDVRRYRKEFKRDLGEDVPYQLGDRQLSPQDLVGAVLSKIKQEAERIVPSHGENSLTKVVLTVPASYGHYKKRLMWKVAEQVGFTDVQFLPEPEAAAYYYNRKNRISNGDIVLVYDLGGGTFDAALLRKEGEGYKSLVPPTGIDGCGGIDFDKQIYRRICGQIKDPLLVERLRSYNNDVKAQQDREILGDFCRGLKHQLSQVPKAFGRLVLDREMYQLTQKDFNLMVGSVIDETLAECLGLVKDANLKLDELNHVLLIGGSCRIPYVRELLEAKLTKPLFHLGEPDLAVCQGAVLFASGTTANRVVKITRDGKNKSNRVGGTIMNKIKTNEIKTNVKTKIIGFDLGHGETALHWTWDYDTDSSGKILESLQVTGQSESFITAIAYDEKQEKVTAIGEAAFTNSESRNIDICFKARPEREATQKVIKDYVKYIYNNLVATKSINPNQDHQILFYVGHPSGWEEENVDLYQEILAEVLPNVKVAPESRAGLMSVIKTNQVTLEDVGKSVLVIDIGSSTTDFTLVKSQLNQPFEEAGADLGGALIDEAIYEKSLEKSFEEFQKDLEATKKDEDKNKTEVRNKLGKYIKDPVELSKAVKEFFSENESPSEKKKRQTIEEINEIFARQSNDSFKSTAKLRCRQLKERYFSGRGFLGGFGFAVKGGFTFEPIKDKNQLKKIINQKFKELGNKTWAEAFYQQLENVKNKLDSQNIEPGALFLTGGASRMDFIQDICEELFPNSKFIRDSKPEFCISKGLALWGKTDYKAAGFLEEVEEFLEKDLSGVIRENIPSFFESLSKVLSQKILYEIVKPSVLSWQSNRITTLARMEEEILEGSKKWLDGEEAKKIIPDIVKQWLENRVLKDIEKEVDKISDKYKLPKGVLIHGYGILDQIRINSRKFSYQGEIITLEASEMPVQALQNIARVVAYVVGGAIIGVVTAIIYGLIALLASSITGAITAVIIAGIALFWWIPAVAGWAKKTIGDVSQAVSDATRQVIRTTNIPSPIRSMLLSDKKIDEILTDNISEIESEIQKSLEGELELVNKIVEETKQPVKKLIEEQAERAKLLIF